MSQDTIQISFGDPIRAYQLADLLPQRFGPGQLLCNASVLLAVQPPLRASFRMLVILVPQQLLPLVCPSHVSVLQVSHCEVRLPSAYNSPRSISPYSWCWLRAGNLLHGADVPLLLQPQAHDVSLVSTSKPADEGSCRHKSPPQAAVDAAFSAARKVIGRQKWSFLCIYTSVTC